MRFIGILTCPQIYLFVSLIRPHYGNLMTTILGGRANTQDKFRFSAATLNNSVQKGLVELRNEVLNKNQTALYFSFSGLW